LLLETSPDNWLDGFIGAHEAIIGVMKAFGLVLVAGHGPGFRGKARPLQPQPRFRLHVYRGADAWAVSGPHFALQHALAHRLGRPFLFSFVRMPVPLVQVVKRAAIWGPLFTTGLAGCWP
jgi:hypothetical protein